MRLWQLVVEALAVLGVGVVVFHYFHRAYAMPLWVVVVALVAGGASALAAESAIRHERRGVVLPTALVALTVVGLVGILSLGIVALVVAAGIAVFNRRRLKSASRAAWTCAGVLGVALPILGLLALQGPVVDCQDGGNRGGENLWLRSDHSSGGGVYIEISGALNERQIGEHRFKFQCSGDDLQYFEQVS